MCMESSAVGRIRRMVGRASQTNVKSKQSTLNEERFHGNHVTLARFFFFFFNRARKRPWYFLSKCHCGTFFWNKCSGCSSSVREQVDARYTGQTKQNSNRNWDKRRRSREEKSHHYLSLNLTELSVIGSYWNLIKCKCRTGGNEAKTTPFSASCRPFSPASYLLSPSKTSGAM